MENNRDHAGGDNRSADAITSSPTRVTLTQSISSLNKVVVYLGDLDAEGTEAIDRLISQGLFTPFQRRSWLDGWRSHVNSSETSKQVTIIGFQAEEPVIALPMTLERSLLFKILAWRADKLNDYCAPLIRRGLLDSLSHEDILGLMRAGADAIGGADVIYLQKQPIRIGGMPNPFVSANAIPHHVGAHSTVLSANWETYYHSKRSSKSRRRLKEKLSSLSRRGAVEMRFAQTPSEAKALVGIGIDMKGEQLGKLSHWNPFSEPGAKQLMIDYFGSRVTSDTWVVALFVDAKPAAISFGFRDSESWLLYQISMTDGTFAPYSPGTHLLMYIMKHCCERGVKTFDLSLGDEHYKDDWCETSSTLMNDVFVVSARGIIASRLSKARSAIRRAIASNAAVYDRAKVVNAWLKRLRRA